MIELRPVVQQRRSTGSWSVLAVDAGFLPTTRRMALAVAGELSAYVTPLGVRGGSMPLRLPKIGPALARRALPDVLASRSVRAGTATETMRLALSRSMIRGFDYRLLVRRNEIVDRAAVRLVEQSTTVIGQYGACAATFERARDLGAATVLDHPIAREQTVQSILADEVRRRPDFAETILSTTGRMTAAHRERIDREVALATAVIVGSTFAARSFEGIVAAERLRVVPYGVDTSMFVPAARTRRRAEPLRVLFAGQVTQRKGIGELLDAMRSLDPAKFRLTIAGPIAGSGDCLRAYDGLYRLVTGVAPHLMPGVYADADVLVLPSLVEGSALVVLEAMASGLPAIVTPNAGADALRDRLDGFVVPVRSPEAIAGRLAELQADEDRRAEMAASARLRALEFDWTAFSASFRAAIGFDTDAGLREAA